MYSYKTIKESSEGLYKEKGSRFISYAYHVTSEEEITPIVQSLKKQYYDARHHCYAWRLGADGKRTRANDDGEPSSTAGRPILGQITSFELTDILIVVIRYFGGTKLGVPGLIRAYKEAAIDAIASSEIIEKTVDVYYKVTFDYEMMNRVMKVVKEISPKIVDQSFDNLSSLTLSIPKDKEQLLVGKFEDIIGIILEYIEDYE